MPYLLSAANMTARRKCGYVNFLMKEVNQETGAKDTKKEDASKPFRLEASFFNILCLLRRAETRIPWPPGVVGHKPEPMPAGEKLKTAQDVICHVPAGFTEIPDAAYKEAGIARPIREQLRRDKARELIINTAVEVLK